MKKTKVTVFAALIGITSGVWLAAGLMLAASPAQSAPAPQRVPAMADAPPARPPAVGAFAEVSHISGVNRAAVDAALNLDPAPAQALPLLDSPPAQVTTQGGITSAQVPVAFDAGAYVLAGRLTLAQDGAGSYTSQPIPVPLERAAPFLGVGTLWQIDTPARYDAAAIAVNVRGSLDGAAWTDWRHYEEFNLITGGVASGLMTLDAATRYVQFQIVWDGARLAGELTFSAGTLIFISPGATPPAQQAQIAAAADSGQVVAPDALSAQAYSAPAVISRTAWGCPQGQSSPAWAPVYRPVTHVIIHHTVNDNIVSDWAAVVRSVWQFHTFSNGWGDIGYNFLIDPNGVVYEGRAGGDRVVGGHFCGQNNGTLGVAMIGTFTSARPTQRALNALNNLLAWKIDSYNLDPAGSSYHASSALTLNTISGHRDGCQTSCPGSGMYDLIPSVRSNVTALVGGGTRPGMPIVSAPSAGASVSLPFDVVLQPGQTNATGASDFRVQVDNNADFTSPEFDNVALNGVWSREATVRVSGLSAGTYYIRAQQGDTVSRSSDWTPSVRVTVRAAPANDSFAGAIPIPALPYRTTQDILGTTVAATDPTPPAACSTGGRQNTVWYRYTPATAQIVRVTTEGSGYDTIAAVYTGREGALTQAACNDDITSEVKSSSLLFSALPGTTYYIMVAKWGASPVSAAASLVLNLSYPANDTFASGVALPTTPATYAFDLFGATISSSDPALSCLGGSRSYVNSIWYRITPAAAGPITLATPGIGTDAVLAVFTGGEGALAEAACSDNAASTPGAALRFEAAAGTTYHILAARAGTSAVTAPTLLTLQVNLPTVLAPGAVSNAVFGSPTYTWADLNAPYYYVYLLNSTGAQVINEVVSRRSAACDGTLCRFDPTTLREAYRLTDGQYSIYINTWADGRYGTPSGPFRFTLDAPLPSLVQVETAQNTNTPRPTLRWSLPAGPARNATSFRVYLAPSTALGAFVLHESFPRTALCGGLEGTACALPLPVDLSSGVTYNAFIQSCGAGGCTTVGGPVGNGYAGPSVFTVSAPPPSLPTNIAVDFGFGFPTVTWRDDPDATHFTLFIGRAPGWQRVFYQVYPRTTGAGGLCDAGTCRVTVPAGLANGAYNFAVQAAGVGGVSVGGRYNNGNGVLENVPLNVPAPGTPTVLIAPTADIITGNPVIEWETVENATRYAVWVGTRVNNVNTALHYQEHTALAPVCTPHPGRCALPLSLNLSTGAYLWNLRAVGAGGNSAWALPVGQTFTVTGTRPGVVTLLQPTGVIDTFTPTFAWLDIADVEAFEVWVGYRASPTAALTTAHQQTYTRAAACVDGLCRLTVPALVLANREHLWNVRAINPAGKGDWLATSVRFTVAVPPPAAPALVSPADDAILYTTNRPTFVWNTVPNARGYILQVMDSQGVLVYNKTHFVYESVCAADRCTVTLPTPIRYGGYRWRVTSGNHNTVGGSADYRDFFSLSLNTEPMVADVDGALVEQRGDWEAAYDDRAREGDYLLSSEAGTDQLSLTFTGTRLDLFYVVGPQFTTFVIEIDGVAQRTIEATAPELRAGQVVSVEQIPPGEHVLRILAAGPVGIDAVSVDGEIVAGLLPTPTPTTAPLQPTAAPLPGTPPATAEVTPQVTAEATPSVEVTAAPTPEATSEATPEATDAPTPEATSEATPEATATAAP